MKISELFETNIVDIADKRRNINKQKMIDALRSVERGLRDQPEYEASFAQQISAVTNDPAWNNQKFYVRGATDQYEVSYLKALLMLADDGNTQAIGRVVMLFDQIIELIQVSQRKLSEIRKEIEASSMAYKRDTLHKISYTQQELTDLARIAWNAKRSK